MLGSRAMLAQMLLTVRALALAGVVSQGPSLVDAAKRGAVDEVRTLLRAGAEVDQRDREENTPLMMGAMLGSLELVELLLDAGADPSLRNGEGISALTIGKASGNAELVERLRAAGARESDEELLHEAIRAGDRERAMTILARGPDVDALDPDDFQTPLMTALAERDLEILLQLTEAGADPTAEGSGIGTTGENAISMAARQKSPWALRVLLEAGARQEDKDRALILGCDVLAVVRVALEAGADANARDREGKSALMCAAGAGSVDVIDALLVAGADAEARSDNGWTAREWARAGGHAEAEKRLADR